MPSSPLVLTSVPFAPVPSPFGFATAATFSPLNAWPSPRTPRRPSLAVPPLPLERTAEGAHPRVVPSEEAKHRGSGFQHGILDLQGVVAVPVQLLPLKALFRIRRDYDVLRTLAGGGGVLGQVHPKRLELRRVFGEGPQGIPGDREKGVVVRVAAPLPV